MKTERFVARSLLPFAAEDVYRWHARPGAFERLGPPWEKVRVLQRHGGIEQGAEVALALRAAGRWRRWVARHHDHEPGRGFADTQVEGPFALWEHRHRFVAEGPSRCWLEDDIEYALPLGRLGRWLGGSMVRRKLQRVFRYRHQVTANDLALHDRYSAGRPLKVLVSGSTGMIGSALVPFLTTGGHQVVRLVRSTGQGGEDTISWRPELGQLETEQLEGLDAIVHLAGENIAARRWGQRQKARIRDSRVEPTTLLCQTLRRLKRPPRVAVVASAIGYYGSRGESWLDEATPPGEGFLAQTCQEWEAATAAARSAGVRVVNLRLGMVLSPGGGAMARMLTPFRLGLGGRIGNGRQWVSWIALDDVLGAIYHALATSELQGPVNAVAPFAVTNRELTRALGCVLGRPTLLPMPGLAARLAFGEMAKELLLASTRVQPRALVQTGYSFLFPELEWALRHLLGKPSVSLHAGPTSEDHQPAEALAGKAG